MVKRLRRSAVLTLALLFAAGSFGGWVFRSPIARFLAPPERDYTPRAELAAQYPRPNADLSTVWKVSLEPGFGGAAIDGGEVFVLDSEAGVADTLRAFDVESGIERWSFSYPAPGRLEFPGSRTAPVVVDELVYTCGSFGQVHCIDRDTHLPVWSLELERDCGGTQPDFGWSSTPLVHAGLVILPALGEDVGLVALDRFTGARVWSTPALGESQSTPVLLELQGERFVVFLSTEVQGSGLEVPVLATVSAFDPATGVERWRARTLLSNVAIPPPVRVDDERLFLTGGYRGGSTLMRLRRERDSFACDEVFHVEKGAQLHPPVVRDGCIYLLANENATDSLRTRRNGGLICLDLAGRELWSTGDDPHFGRGHMLQLGGERVLIQDGLSGMLRLARVSPRGYTQEATVNVFEVPPKARERMWAPMARAGDVLIARGYTELRCVHLGDARTRP